MTAPNTTPGPWWIEEDCDGFAIVGRPNWGCTRFGVKGEWDVAKLDTDGADDRPNAHLIAAAPELYEALEDCVTVLTDEIVGTIYHDEPAWYDQLDAAVAKARDALRKARGEA